MVPEVTLVVAVIAVEPPTVRLAALSCTTATPLTLVSAVPDEGDSVAYALLVTNVTSALGTTAPLASFTVALTVTDPVAGICVIAAPVPSVIETVIVGVLVVVVVVVDDELQLR